MKKIITKFFIISLFTCLCFFGIDKVYAFTYDNWQPESITCNGKECGVQSNFGNQKMFGAKMGKSSNSWIISFKYNLAQASSENEVFNLSFISYSDQLWDYQKGIENGSFSITWWSNSDTGSCSTNTTGTDKTAIISCSDVSVSSNKLFYLKVHLNYVFSSDGDSFYLMSNFEKSKSVEQNILNSLNTIAQAQGAQKQTLDNINKNQQETNKKLQETNDTLKDDDTSEASGEAESFFSGFSTDTHGLTSIITAPLQLIGSITSSTCSPLKLDVPFVDGKKLELPCMSSIYKKHFGSFLSIYQIATFGLIAYWVCVRIFALVKDFKDPDKDEVEVMDL